MVVVDDKWLKPFEVRWDGGAMKFETASEANLCLKLVKSKRPELWVKARHQ